MLNIVWLFLIVSSVLIGAWQGHLSDVLAAVTGSAKSAVDLLMGIAGILIFWSGLMKIAEKAGLINLLSVFFAPALKKLFPDVPPDHPAMEAIVSNMTANFLGLGSAATPFGLKAMAYLKALNGDGDEASDAMCTFLAINTCSIQLIPATGIALLAAAGADRPTDIVFTAFLASLCALVFALFFVRFLSKSTRFQIAKQG